MLYHVIRTIHTTPINKLLCYRQKLNIYLYKDIFHHLIILHEHILQISRLTIICHYSNSITGWQYNKDWVQAPH